MGKIDVLSDVDWTADTLAESLKNWLEIGDVHGKIEIAFTKDWGFCIGKIFGGFKIGTLARIQSNFRKVSSRI